MTAHSCLKPYRKKYPHAPKEFIWQCLFPVRALTVVPETDERKRYPLHPGHVQKAIRKAVYRAKIARRYSFSGRLLQANYDIWTIQELPDNRDLKTTMIYTYMVKSRTIKDAQSPPDITNDSVPAYFIQQQYAASFPKG